MHEIMHVELWLMSKCHVRGGSTFKSRVRPCPAVFTRLKTALILEYTGRVYSFSPPQTGRYPTPCDGTRHPSTHGDGWQPYSRREHTKNCILKDIIVPYKLVGQS